VGSVSERNPNDQDDSIRVDLLIAQLRASSRLIVGVTVAMTLAVALGAGLYYVIYQPTRTTASLEFRPTFDGADKGLYPNGLTFSAVDVIAASVLDQVHARNELTEVCPIESFKAGFFVERRSVEAAFLDAEFQGRLADPRLTVVDRQNLAAEYEARREALPAMFQLVFVRPTECEGLPDVLMRKALADTLLLWAEESENARGVLQLPMDRFVPSVLDISADTGMRVVRAEMLRARLRRLAVSVAQVKARVGAVQVRTKDGTTVQQVETELDSLINAQLVPIVLAAGQMDGAAGRAWVESMLSSARVDASAAENRVHYSLNALKEYTGAATAASATSSPERVSESSGSSVTAQIDRSFVDRIVALSAQHVLYRQKLTDELLLANLEAEEGRLRVTYFESLQQGMRSMSSAFMPEVAFDARLKTLTEQSVAVATKFNALFDEISRVTLRAASSLYQAEKPPRIATVREFTSRAYMILVASVFLATLVLMAGFVLLRARFAAQ